MDRVEREDDPRRCQSVYKHGQCPYRAVEHGTMCPMHGGGSQERAHTKKVMEQYNLAMWQARTQEFASHDKVKTLRDEVGLLRVVLENVVQKCNDSNQLLIYSSKIADLIMKVEKLVVSMNRLEASTGMLLDKSAALHLAGQMVEIITKYVNDPVAIDQIAADIARTILEMNGASVE